MIAPTKHELLEDSLLVVGHTVLKRLKRKSFVVEDLYVAIKTKHNISLATFFDTLTFLWCSGLIVVNNYEVRIKPRVT